jgi:hypothetical protein
MRQNDTIKKENKSRKTKGFEGIQKRMANHTLNEDEDRRT